VAPFGAPAAIKTVLIGAYRGGILILTPVPLNDASWQRASLTPATAGGKLRRARQPRAGRLCVILSIHSFGGAQMSWPAFRISRETRAAVVVVALMGTLVAGAQSLPIENIQLRGDRFRGLSYREMTPEQRVMLEHTVNSARAVTNTTANGPFNVLLRSPEVGDLSQQLGNALRFSSDLSGRLRELATLMAGRAWTSSYEWYAHARYAADEGIPPDVIDAIAAHRIPKLESLPPEDGIVWRVADELLYTRRVTDTTFREALEVLGERRLVSVVTLAAYYEYVSMLLNTDRYPLPADAPAGATTAVRPLPAEALYRQPAGVVTVRPALGNEDADRALEALHARVSADGELPPEVRDAAFRAVLRQWNRAVAQHGESLAYEFAAELLDTRAVTDATFARARQVFGERRLVELIVLMGYANIRCAQAALAGAACSL